MADGADAAELFDIEMDELPRVLAFITPDRVGRLQGTQLIKPTPFEDATDGRRRDADFGRNLLAGVALAAQHLDGVACGLRSLAWR